MNRPPTQAELLVAGVDRRQLDPETPVCRPCLAAAQVIRRLGFRDSVSWGVIPGAPTQRLHATHSNALRANVRVETEGEYKRRMMQRMGETQEQFATRVAGEPPCGHVTIAEKLPQSLCVFHASELAWLSVARPRRLTVYMAHPVAEVRSPSGHLVGNSFADNVLEATCFLKFLRRVPLTELQEIVGAEFEQRPLILAPWLAGIEEDDSYPGGREAILQDSRDAAMLFDEVWCLGGRVSPGMVVESAASVCVRDLTHLGSWAKFRPPQRSSKASLRPRSRS